MTHCPSPFFLASPSPSIHKSWEWLPAPVARLKDNADHLILGLTGCKVGLLFHHFEKHDLIVDSLLNNELTKYYFGNKLTIWPTAGHLECGAGGR